MLCWRGESAAPPEGVPHARADCGTASAASTSTRMSTSMSMGDSQQPFPACLNLDGDRYAVCRTNSEHSRHRTQDADTLGSGLHTLHPNNEPLCDEWLRSLQSGGVVTGGGTDNAAAHTPELLQRETLLQVSRGVGNTPEALLSRIQVAMHNCHTSLPTHRGGGASL